MPTDEQQTSFADAVAWRGWLDFHHADTAGVWLAIAKKGSDVRTVSHQEALDVAICFGWIDAQRKSLDETYFLQRFCRRRPRSAWSKINRSKAEAFIESGIMTAAGLHEVESAKADGRWDAAYDGQRTATVPPDLEAAWHGRPKAQAFFKSLDSQNRYAILYRIQQAKRPETRARRIATFVDMLEANEKIYP